MPVLTILGFQTLKILKCLHQSYGKNSSPLLDSVKVIFISITLSWPSIPQLFIQLD